MQSLWLPAIQAQLALDKKNPASALSALQAASPIELGEILFVANISCLYPTYVRGEAYLAAGQGNDAAAEFQKIIDHSGIVWNCWTGALAHLGVARANALQSRTSQGRGCRSRPQSGARRLQRFPYALERRRPRHPHPEGSQSGVRQAAIAGKSLVSSLAVCRWFTKTGVTFAPCAFCHRVVNHKLCSHNPTLAAAFSRNREPCRI